MRKQTQSILKLSKDWLELELSSYNYKLSKLFCNKKIVRALTPRISVTIMLLML